MTDFSDDMQGSAVFVISVAAELSGMHPQTLRQYDRLGLVQPSRSAGGGRRYSLRDVVMLREISRLSQEDGVNLAGIKRIIELEQQVEVLQAQVEELAAALAARPPRGPSTELVPLSQSVLPIWRPHR